MLYDSWESRRTVKDLLWQTQINELTSYPQLQTDAHLQNDQFTLQHPQQKKDRCNFLLDCSHFFFLFFAMI